MQLAIFIVIRTSTAKFRVAKCRIENCVVLLAITRIQLILDVIKLLGAVKFFRSAKPNMQIFL
jgi:hypothetical protein